MKEEKKNTNKKKNKGLRIVLILLLIALVVGSVVILNLNKGKKATKLKKKDGITIVPTLSDKLNADSSWCGTFQLLWNDVKDELVKGDVIFNPQIEMAENLNKSEFTVDMLSEEYYFKLYGTPSLGLKSKIINGIREKFNLSSDVLNNLDIDFNSSGENKYIFFSMLYREFEFLKVFDKLEKDTFGNQYKDVEYFGIDKYTPDDVRKQIDVLYYNSQDDFAILINTKNNDEVIFCKCPQGETFGEIYENMNIESQNYEYGKKFGDDDEFKAPNLDINIKTSYPELLNKKFKINDSANDVGEIEQAIQTIEFSINEKGGRVMSISSSSIATFGGGSISIESKPRYFYVDDTFVIFIREKGKSLPYFAARIEDITKYQ